MKKRMIAIGTIASVGLVLSHYACNSGRTKMAPVNPADSAQQATNAIEQGRHLVAIMGCNDCHSPKRMGPNGPEVIPELLLSGYPADRPIVKMDSKLIKEGFGMFYPDLTAGAGPWGMSFAGNLTPDGSGIGNWTEAQFKKALTEGKYKGLDGGRALLPPMPWPNYKELTNEEVHAIFSYLKSIKPVNNVVPSPITPDKL